MSVNVTSTPATAAPAPVLRLPDRLVAQVLTGVLEMLTDLLTGSNWETTLFAVVLAEAVTVTVVARR